MIRHHEIALKGRNRPDFEKRLRDNLRRCLASIAGPLEDRVLNLSGRFAIEVPAKCGDLREAIDRLSRVPGVSAVTPCLVVSPEVESICAAAVEWARLDLERNPDVRTFAVRARRVDKSFPVSSSKLDCTIGESIQRIGGGHEVHLRRPDLKIHVEVRHKHAMIYSWEKSGIRGLPMDSAQRVVCLLSGGIDSPVATHEITRRGCSAILLHFHSRPFTSEASVSKVRRLAGMLRKSSAFPLELWLVPLLEIQKAVRDACDERHRTVHYRRFMMMIAQELAVRRGARALVTGEALGQVASQTLANMQAIEEAVSIPVLRPLIACDKEQIIAKARQLGTYEVSIEPHDDSCTLFAPRNPATQARLSLLQREADSLPQYELMFAALDAAEKEII